jgi:membrane-associated phospholipid phosphatase
LTHWLQNLDAGLFHWVNPTLSNPVFDVLMPFVSGNRFFVPAVVLICALMICKGGARGRVCVLLFLLAIGLTDGVVCNSLKHLIGRPRPFLTLADIHMPPGVGRTDSGSLPSAHAANWFAATMVFFIYYRRSIRFMLPLALLVSFSRIYNGVHYPGDVLIGAVLGMGCGGAAVWLFDALWQWAGRRWFSLWHQRLPSLWNPVVVPVPDTSTPQGRTDESIKGLADRQWLRLGYLLIFVQFFANLAYNASGKIGLSEDEAYQWVWSKHLALSYYSKPLMIAVTQFLGTTLFGDTVFGVRFFAPVITAVMGVVLLRFMARVVNARAAFWLSVILPTVPLAAAGSILMTIDPLSVMFWTLAMLAGWRAVQENATTGDWLWVGWWMGLGFLSKYTGLLQLLSWAVFFALWPPARKQLRRPGPWLALLVNAICTLPVLIWNAQHHWITVDSVAGNGHLGEPWAFTLANLWQGLRHTGEFLGAELGLLNPFYFLAVIWAAVMFWRRQRGRGLPVYFFSMGAPLFLCCVLFTLHSRVNANWIAPSVVPLLCLGVVYWDGEWRKRLRAAKFWLIGGLLFGALAIVLMHDNDLIHSIVQTSGKPLPPKADALRRVEGWPETAQVVEEARQKLLAEGKPVFIIGGHYGITGEISFLLPEARENIRSQPLVYYRSSKTPENQFYFWPGYGDRKGQNAIYVEIMDGESGPADPPPEELTVEFESVKSLGEFTITHNGRYVRRIQISECRNLR